MHTISIYSVLLRRQDWWAGPGRDGLMGRQSCWQNVKGTYRHGIDYQTYSELPGTSLARMKCPRGKNACCFNVFPDHYAQPCRDLVHSTGTYIQGASLRGGLPPATLAHKETTEQNNVK